MLSLFAKEPLKIIRNKIRLDKKLLFKAFSTLNEDHTTSDRQNLDLEPKNQDKFRRFTKDEIERVPFSNPYFEHLEGNYYEAPLDLNTKSVSESPLLLKSNVGVGFMTLNSEYLGSGCIASLCRELSDLETNVYKRMVVLTSMTRSVFSKGLDMAEISLFFESYAKLSKLNTTKNQLGNKMDQIKEGLYDYLNNICDLLYIMRTYKKPLLVYGNGQMEAFGANLCFISSYSACYKHSSYQLNLSNEYYSIFGSSFMLSNLKGNMGEYLLLTNDKLVGEELIWAGLVKKYIEPNSINNIQITSDRLVELPEKYVETYVNEFNLNVSKECRLKEYEQIIEFHFKHESIGDIINSIKRSYLKKMGQSSSKLEGSKVKKFEASLLKMIERTSGNKNVEEMFNIIKKLKVIRCNILSELNITPKEWNEMVSLSYKSSTTIKEDNMKLLYGLIMEILLIESLSMELELFYSYPYQGSLSKYLNSQSKMSRNDYEYKAYPRNEMSLSNIRRLKELNVNYNRKTGCEYDKAFMKQLESRYRADHLKDKFRMMKDILNIP
ncbi:conserved hypothetical protein [Theileria orientalis strain Shintoku]|uniref:Enoyl-CoA hydratase/isomerase domain-containing protein n=1 Tax=Theileria orientalis strain Shintoku TaxID=869250 RepID=J4C402_THEOR|nr:conserved hypothetical protein [Theileria orientalis strain Shintoku]PVC49708.1 hypothetical protein MACL_00002811 [Theileria orientalis]BAM41331.1 conserved hypothetical protein [Theileria orientalis strain Shintoku]|eukprot:XP_009691632.1 conserved hypothetical protein [Theileria orientalis strain Shintoku]